MCLMLDLRNVDDVLYGRRERRVFAALFDGSGFWFPDFPVSSFELLDRVAGILE